jgi:hypothetical protein
VHGSGPNLGPGVRAAWILDFVPDDRSWRRRTWDRWRELRGVVVPRRAAEMREVQEATHADSERHDPEWLARPV